MDPDSADLGTLRWRGERDDLPRTSEALLSVRLAVAAFQTWRLGDSRECESETEADADESGHSLESHSAQLRLPVNEVGYRSGSAGRRHKSRRQRLERRFFTGRDRIIRTAPAIRRARVSGLRASVIASTYSR